MGKQVFQTDSRSRWKRFKWGLRIVSIVFIILLAALVTMLIVDQIPNLPFHQDFRNVASVSKPWLKDTKMGNEYHRFRRYFWEKTPHNNYAQEKREAIERYARFQGKGNATKVKYMQDWYKYPAGIRAGFYVAWDPQSFFSLKRNIKNMNLVMPEWFFVDPKTDKVSTNVDQQGFALMKRSGVPIMPMFSNNYEREFRSEAISRIIHSPAKRKAVINQVLNECLRNNFVGINLDLEELQENDNSYLTQFVSEMADAFHAHGLLITQDIMPSNEDYDVKALARKVDYFVLMAYDEYTDAQGPISSQKWIESTVDNLTRIIPPEKIILGLGAYGYDTPALPGQEASVTYQQALSRAKASGAVIHFDNTTYNLDFNYQDDHNNIHHVYFNDAASHFNAMRFGAEDNLAGFGLWRLGSEDSRVWKFYTQNMEWSGVQHVNKHDLEDVKIFNDVDYVGDGEILDVLNTPHSGHITTEIDSSLMLISEERYQQIPGMYQIHRYGEAADKQLLITFDDGPDERWTPKILDILASYHVPAAFFVVGLEAEKNLPLIKRIYSEGHMIGNHTFTHRNVAKNSPYRTFMELQMTRLLIECITGHTTILFRAPYNADSEPTTLEELIPVVLARQQNYLDVGESIDPEDWQVGIKADEIVRRVITQVNEGRGHIILLHDAGGDTRKETIKALPVIIEYFQKRGYTFIGLPQLLGKNRDQLMPPVPKGKEYYAMQANLVLATIIYNVTNFLAALFFIFIVLGIIRLAFMVVMMIRQRRKERNFQYPELTEADYPRVSIIVPAYNEEVNAVASLRNLLQQKYPNFNVIFVDDGSTDGTYQCVCEAFSNHPQVEIFTHPNGGKASALNFGIEHTDAEFVVCIDADTKLYPNALSLMIRHFMGERGTKVGAVAGNVKVGNQCNVMTLWQAIEYTTSQNFDREAYANLNAITVVPGAIGMFRRQAIADAGGLTTDTLAEDCDLTIRILRAGYVIENENKAIAMTEAPEKVKQFIKQRTRWSFGIMQTFWKHRSTLCSRRYKGLGLWAMPNMLIFQFIIPVFSPLADLFMLFGLFSGNAGRIGLYYLIFMLVDSSISIVAFLFEKEKLWKLWLILPQRFCYRWIMYVVLFKSFKKAIKGELQTWGVLKRTGKVKDIN